MANRRMFSLKIVDSAKFLKMPPSTRLLYYDLCMRADDDGVVEGFNVLRITGSTEDDLKVLVAKDFIKVLNEDLVSYVTDWKEHNKIRADRKVDSIYKDLLLQVLPDVKLLEPKQRADSKAKKDNKNQEDNNWTSKGQTEDGIGKDRLGKDRLGKDRLGNKNEFSVFNYLEENGFILNAIDISNVNNDMDKYSKEIIKQAIDKTLEKDIFSYNYVRKILQSIKAKKEKKSVEDNKMKKVWEEFLKDE